ncbi:hypothetical protein ACNKHL_25120 [Shigella flexneri]
MLFDVAAFAMSWGPVTRGTASKIFRMLFVVKRWASRRRPKWLANYFVSWTFPMMDILLLVPISTMVSLLDLRCMGVLQHVYVETCSGNKAKPLRSGSPLQLETKKTQQTATLSSSCPVRRASSARCFLLPLQPFRITQPQSDDQ